MRRSACRMRSLWRSFVRSCDRTWFRRLDRAWGAVVSLTVRKTFWMFSLLASIIYPLTLGAIFDMPGTTKPKKVKKKVATALIAPMTVKAIAAPNGRRAAASFSLNGPMVTREFMPSARNTTAKTRVKHHTMRKVLTTRERFFCVLDTF